MQNALTKTIKPGKPTQKLEPRFYQLPSVIEHTKSFKKGYKSDDGVHINARIDGSDTGTGKTYIAAFTALALGMPVLILAPKNALKVWERVLNALNIQDRVFVGNYEKVIRSTTPYFRCYDMESADREYAAAMLKYESDCLKAGPIEALKIIKPARREFDPTFVCHIPENTFIILDEVHRCKGVSSITAELLHALTRLNRQKPMQYPILALSATKATSAADMRATGFMLGLHTVDNFESWAMLNGCITNSYGVLDYSGGDAGLHHLHKQIYPKRGCRVRKSDLPAGTFAKTTIKAEAYNMGKDAKQIQAVYDEMDRELDRYMAGLSTSKGMSPFTIILRARQQVELLKVPAVVKMAQDSAKKGNRVVIFVNFTETLHAICKRLNTDCAYYGGNKASRENWLKRFQENDPACKYMVINVAAGSEAISCHDLDGRFPRESLIMPTWSGIKTVQVFGRVDRDGGKSESVQRLIFAAGTIEERVAEKARRKVGGITALNDGDLIPDSIAGFLKSASAVKAKKVEAKEFMKALADVIDNASPEDEE